MKNNTIDYPEFKGMDIQNKKYLISVGTNGIFIAGLEENGSDVHISYDEIYKYFKKGKNK